MSYDSWKLGNDNKSYEHECCDIYECDDCEKSENKIKCAGKDLMKLCNILHSKDPINLCEVKQILYDMSIDLEVWQTFENEYCPSIEHELMIERKIN